MSASETLQAVLSAVEACEWQRARSYLTDDFVFGGAVPQPVGPDAWLAIHQALAAAMPDFSFNPHGLHEENGVAIVQLQLTGTQTRDLKAPVPGLTPVPATGKRVSLPTETISATARGDKLTSIMVSEVPGGGLAGVLAQLGVTVPARG